MVATGRESTSHLQDSSWRLRTIPRLTLATVAATSRATATGRHQPMRTNQGSLSKERHGPSRGCVMQPMRRRRRPALFQRKRARKRGQLPNAPPRDNSCYDACPSHNEGMLGRACDHRPPVAHGCAACVAPRAALLSASMALRVDASKIPSAEGQPGASKSSPSSMMPP